jgi:hypothetical protein
MEGLVLEAIKLSSVTTVPKQALTPPSLPSTSA